MYIRVHATADQTGSRMRTLVIAPQPFFSPRGTPFSVYYRTLIMSQLGARIDLLTYGEGQDVDLPNVRIIRIPRFRFLGPVKTGPSLLKLFLDCFVALWTVALLVRNRYAVVHAHEEAVFFCRFLKPVFRFKLVYDMHSSLPQQLRNFDFTKSRIVGGIFRWLENSSIRTADAVITICPDLADYVATINDKPEKHFLIENSLFDPVRLKSNPADDGDDGASASTISPRSDPPQGRPLIVYAGTLEHYQGIDILIKSFAMVIETHALAFLVIVGGTDEQVARYKQLAQDIGIGSHILFTGRLPQEMANTYINSATILVSPRSEGTNTPLKIYQQLASGIPLVATNIYSHTQVLTPDVAILVDPNPKSMARGIIKALNDPNECNSLVDNAQNLYAEEYSRESYIAKMKRLVSLLESKNTKSALR